MSARKAYKSKLQYETNTTNHTDGLNSARKRHEGLNSSRNISEALSSARNKTETYFTPRNRYQDMKFDFVESLREYSNEAQPTIDEKTREEIIRKENIYESVIQNWRHRENRNDFFLPYNYNPFVTTHTQYEERKREEKRMGVKIVNLIDQMDRKTENIPKMNSLIEKSKKDIDYIARESMIRSSKFVSTVARQKLEWKEREFSGEISNKTESKACSKGGELVKSQVYQSFAKKGMKNKEEVGIKSKEVEKYKDIEIESIVAEKELSFYAKNKKENHINIFKINQEEEEEIKTYYTLLEELRFNFESVVDKLPSVKIPYLRDLSQLGRGVLVNNYKGKELIENHVDMRESTFLYTEITFDNIMCLATHRISPETIQESMKTNLMAIHHVDDDQSEIEEEQQIIYYNNMRQQQNNYETDLQQKEVELYHNMSYSEEEEEAFRFYEEKGNSIEKQLNFKSYLFDNMILEEEVHHKLERILERENKAYLKSDKGYEDEDFVRLINLNKYKKDRKELIKIKELKKMLMNKNLNDEKNKNYFIKQQVMKLIQ